MEKAIAKVDTTLLDKMKAQSEAQGRSSNPIDKLEKIKIYNAPPSGDTDESKAGQILIKEGEYFVPMGKSFTFNLLTIKKVLGGRYPLRDSFGQIEKIGGETQYGFGFTEEFQDQYFKNINEVSFRNKTGVVKMQLGELKQMLKTKEINGTRNPFYKTGKTMDDEDYDASWITQSYMMYGIFTSGDNIGELFRMQLSNSNYGVTYKDSKQVEADPNTILDAIKQGLIQGEEVNGFAPAREFMNISCEVVKAGDFYKGKFEFQGLIDFDNQTQNEELHKILNEAYEYNFGKNKGNIVLENKVNNILTPTVDNLNKALEEKKEVHEKLVKKVDQEISIDQVPFRQ